MTLSFEVNGVALPDEAVLIVGSAVGGVGGLPSSAWYGEPSTATVIVDDPNGDYDFRAWDVFTADESAAANPRVFTGWVFETRMSRGPLPYKFGAARVWELDIIDQNACLSFEVFRANSAQRPDETDLARIEFILESAPMAGTPVVAGPLTNLTDNPFNLQSADFVRQYPVEAFTSTAGQSGKTFYVFWNQDDEELQLFYDQIPNYPAADAAISNLMADEGAGVFYPLLDGSLRRAGDQIYTGELLDYVGGAVYARNSATIDRLSPTPLSPINFLRDFMRRSDQIGLASTANAIVAEDLAQHATEEDTITVTVRVPAANVNDIEAGQRVMVTFSHLVGYETPTEVNVIRRNVVPTEGRVDMYDIYFELSNKAKLRDLDGGDPDDLPAQPCNFDDVDVVQSGSSQVVGGAPGTITIGAAGTPGNTMLIWACHREKTTALTIDGYTDITGNIDAVADAHQTWRAHMFYRHIDETDTATLDCTVTGTSAGIKISYAELQGQLTPDTFDTESIGDQGCSSPRPLNAGTVTTTGSSSLLVAGISGRNDVNVATSTTWDSPAVEVDDSFGSTLPPAAMAYKVVSGAGSQTFDGDFAFSGCLRGWVSAVIVFSCTDGEACPATGQWVENETVTLTGADGTTRCPFADGSLHVFIDNVEQTATLASQDGATGDFTLGFTPTPTEVCTVMYQGR